MQRARRRRPPSRRRESRTTRSQHSGVQSRTIREVFPGTVVAPYLMLGGSDAHHFYTSTEDVYRFMPFLLSEHDLEGIHGTDERVSIEALSKGCVSTYGSCTMPPVRPPRTRRASKHTRQSSNRRNPIELLWKTAGSAFGRCATASLRGCRIQEKFARVAAGVCPFDYVTMPLSTGRVCLLVGHCCVCRRSRVAGTVHLESESSDPSHSPRFVSRSGIDDSRKRR